MWTKGHLVGNEIRSIEEMWSYWFIFRIFIKITSFARVSCVSAQGEALGEDYNWRHLNPTVSGF